MKKYESGYYCLVKCRSNGNMSTLLSKTIDIWQTDNQVALHACSNLNYFLWGPTKQKGGRFSFSWKKFCHCIFTFLSLKWLIRYLISLFVILGLSTFITSFLHMIFMLLLEGNVEMIINLKNHRFPKDLYIY